MNDNQKQFLAKATQSPNAAQYLYDGEYYDFAIARAYYTMFYVASAFLEGEGLSFSKHSAVISTFGREFAKTGRIPKEFHRHLKEAQDLRLLGDYGEMNILEKEEAATQIERATAFLDPIYTHL